MMSLTSAAAFLLLAADAGPGAVEGGGRSLRLAADSAVRLQVPCTAGTLLQATVEPELQPVVMELLDPAGELLAEVRNPARTDDPMPLSAVPIHPGACTLALRLESGPPGEVVLRLEPPRPATARDRTRLDGERLHQRALHLWVEGSETSLRQALALEERAAALAHEAGDLRGEADAHFVSGNMLWQLGDIEGAYRELTTTIALREPLGDPRALAQVYNDRGVIQGDLSNLAAGLEDLERAQSLAEPLGHPHLQAEILHNIAFAQWSAKQFERALELFRASQRLGATGRTAPYLDPVTTDTIGMVLYDLHRLEEAERQFRRALQIHRTRGDRRQQAISLTHLGWVYSDTNRLAEAEHAYREALALLTTVGDRFNLAFALDGLGEVLALRGRPEEALVQHRAALRVAEQAPDPNQQAISLTNMATALRRLGRLEEARDVLVRAVDLTESGRLTRPGSSGRISWTARNRNRYELLVSVLWDLQQRAPDGARVAQMFRVSERARARTLLDLLSEARVDLYAGADPELVARERRLMQDAERVSAEAARRAAAGSGVPAEMPELRAILSEVEDVRRRLRQHQGRSAALTRPEPLGADQVQSRVLDGETVLLEYLVGEDRSFLFVVTPGSLEVHPLPGRAALERELRRLTRLWQSARADALTEQRTASRVGRLLLGPAAERIAGKRLAIAADGALHELPFPALVLPGSGKRVVEAHEVVLLPSASALAALRASPRPDQHTGAVAVLADPVFGRGDPRLNGSGAMPLPADLRRSLDELGLQRLVRLPGTRIEAEAILSLVPAGQRLAALGFEARRALAMDPEVGRYHILHFATHGLLNSAHPELSGLVLSLVDEHGDPQNGFLRLQDVYQMRIEADLVVLSACQTALGKQVQGEGVLGLTRGFLHAGARQVLASLWKVPDRGTAELMKELYRAMLVEGQRPPAALRQAQRKLLRTRPFDAPDSWAAFVLQGDWQGSPHAPGEETRH